MMAQSNRKFKDGDIVYDGYNRVIGKISGYLGKGLYTLEDVCAPLLGPTGEVRYYIKLTLDTIDLNFFCIPGIEGRQRVYIQSSRYLNKPNPNLLQVYQEHSINPVETEIYYYDGYQTLLRLPEAVLEYRGGSSPAVYTMKIAITERWSINGYIFNKRLQDLQSVVKINSRQNWIISLNQNNFGLVKDEIEFVFIWEKEFAPYVIQGQVL